MRFIGLLRAKTLISSCTDAAVSSGLILADKRFTYPPLCLAITGMIDGYSASSA
jgi:hypothetical protein